MFCGSIDFQNAIWLGLLEGLTEFIPVSSTGHLILLGDLLEFSGEKADTFNIFIQLGAIFAVVVLYWRRFVALVPVGKNREEGGFSGYTGISKLVLACLPAFIAGPLFYDTIKDVLFAPLPVAAALIVGGILMLWVEGKQRTSSTLALEDITYRQSLIIGVCQCLAMWPGMSRSGSTIIGAMLVGCHRQVAAEFSFLLAVPVMCAAVSYDLLKSIDILSLADVPLFALGFLVAFVSGMAAIKFFISLLGKFTMRPFGYYRMVLGLVVIIVWEFVL